MLGSFFLLALVLVAFGIITGVAVIVVMALAILRPPRMTDGKAVWVLRRMSPGDLGLSFEDANFRIRDQRKGTPIRIAGWWIPHPSAEGKCVVLLHGYADAKVGSIAWAPLWHRLGFNILAIDLRAHGESGGVYCSAGFWERHDLNQVLDQAIAERPGETREIVLFGVSLGAATAVATAALRDDIAAVILESPPASFTDAAMAHMDRLGAPGRLFQRQAITLAEALAGCEFDAVRPDRLLAEVPCPVLLISPEDDPMVDERQRAAMHQALQGRRRGDVDRYWSLDTGHMLAMQAKPLEYQTRLSDFLGQMARRA